MHVQGLEVLAFTAHTLLGCVHDAETIRTTY
jgi:hypothetical protein